MTSKRIIVLLAIGHGINDLLAGYYLGGMVKDKDDLLQAGLALFIYNLLAFGGQYPIALWLEKFSNRKTFLVTAFVLNTAAISLFGATPNLAVVLAGVASAIYHVTGGSICAAGERSVGIGWFAAPGVAGLIGGGYFAWQDYSLTGLLLLLSLLFLVMLVVVKIPAKGPSSSVKTAGPSIIPDRHDLVMIVLLTVISLRSAIWNIFQLIHEENYSWLLAIALAAFIGKIAGGWLADRIGWRLYMYISLLAATPLISFFKDELLLFCIGIGLLQSGIPASTALLIQSVKGKTERGIALAFGTSILAGAFTFSFPERVFVKYAFIPAGLVLLIFLFLWLPGRGRRVS